MTKHIIAFFLNPVAGMGGRVGLKGTDGMADRARELGANEVSPDRAFKALTRLFHLVNEDPDLELEILTAGSPMGIDVCERVLDEIGNDTKRSGIKSVTVRDIYQPNGTTSSDDTKEFCRLACAHGAEIVLFTGGDGTARDVVAGVDEGFPILGVPSGVKMHSGVFTIRPGDAGKVITSFLKGEASLETREVMDLDEDQYRAGKIRTKLFGYATVPVTTTVQGCKNIVSSADEEFERGNIAAGLKEFMEEHPGIYVMGAGSTLKDIGDELGIRPTIGNDHCDEGTDSEELETSPRISLTPLGFDILSVTDGIPRVLRMDVNEEKILSALSTAEMKDRYIVITPIGAQGFILGRGTQVISEKVLEQIQPENIIVVATPGKLAITPTLRVDVGPFNEILRGFVKVMSGYHRFVLKKIE